MITSSNGRTPTDAALGPTGTIAVISFGDGDRYSVHIVDPAGTNFDTTDAIYETSLHLEAVSIAADGAIWVLEGDGDPTTADPVITLGRVRDTMIDERTESLVPVGTAPSTPHQPQHCTPHGDPRSPEPRERDVSVGASTIDCDTDRLGTHAYLNASPSS